MDEETLHYINAIKEELAELKDLLKLNNLTQNRAPSRGRKIRRTAILILAVVLFALTKPWEPFVCMWLQPILDYNALHPYIQGDTASTLLGRFGGKTGMEILLRNAWTCPEGVVYGAIIEAIAKRKDMDAVEGLMAIAVDSGVSPERSASTRYSLKELVDGLPPDPAVLRWYPEKAFFGKTPYGITPQRHQEVGKEWKAWWQ
ncbi:MAG: hypothetical protein HY318_04015 [Armatimonadetes bacterium]|nr:hypothetical protein [Armatimonadota bacterium]